MGVVSHVSAKHEITSGSSFEPNKPREQKLELSSAVHLVTMSDLRVGTELSG